MKILITGGGTVEHIDSVRFLTNISSGRTASLLVDYLSKENKITYLTSITARYMPKNIRKIKMLIFSDFNTLKRLIKKELSKNNYDAVIHLAAVSDYSPIKIKINGKFFKTPLKEKIDSESKPLQIILKKNFKIIDRLKDYSKNKKIIVVGFKLTSNVTAKKIISKIQKIKADIVVHNDTSQIKKSKHIFNIYKSFKNISKAENPKELAKKLSEILRKEGM
ncbi:MAG: hypothetical protein N2Z60_05085 [Elusimicrobiales bacterium]|nr:hypothetical protein [Elusimicrobiales bacterium]